MGELVYFMNTSLDGYVEDATGAFDFTEPSDEVHKAAEDLIRPAGTYVYGRRIYETMAVWETDPALANEPGVNADFAAVWQAADKLVYSTTLTEPITRRTTIERDFDPAAMQARKDASPTDLFIAGPTLAAEAFRAGLVDRIHLFVAPVTVGAGKAALPTDLRLELAFVDARPFASGTVHLEYTVTR